MRQMAEVIECLAPDDDALDAQNPAGLINLDTRSHKVELVSATHS